MPVTIPERFATKLHTDASNEAYEGYINTLIHNAKHIITDKADFFPEYTLHGWTHIQAVLYHADKLIPDVSMKELSGRDVAMLIASVIVHDLGMFINKAGVKKLLNSSRSRTKTVWLDKHDWNDEWNCYIQEIRRYPEEKLLYHFGASYAVNEPDIKEGKLSDLDLLVVGEFLRRHHHRLAHEIALNKMPGANEVDVLQVGIDASGRQYFDDKDRRWIGILARSHGMPIRKTWDYLDGEIGKQHREKLTYLMVVLRIADALDADEQRVPDTVRKLVGIQTPVSVLEWSWNEAIKKTDVDWKNNDDSKYVEADPKNTTQFVHLEEWLKNIQTELDLSWAVLSEVCDMQKFRLSIHRIKSNIFEEKQRESYENKFITRNARLKANPEMLKLLVAPLYDNDPSCGVRELLQNAVDACNERAHLEDSNYRGQVEIRLDTNAKTLTVTDNGIGMDENVLLNYYLSAGASYRSSNQWFEQFARDREPEIVRTGRFGIGVLATFLLGHQVEVRTRHINDTLGYIFEFGLEPKTLDVRRPKKGEEIQTVGTTITVQLIPDAMKKLQADYEKKQTWLNWYRFEEPTVRYYVDKKEYRSEKPFVPHDKKAKDGWHDLPWKDIEMARWGYPSDGFFYNGIRIPNELNTYYELKSHGIFILAPSVSIVDRVGKLEPNLQRTRLHNWPTEINLQSEVMKCVIARLLALDWLSEEKKTDYLFSGFPYVATNRLHHTNVPFICTSVGYMLPGKAFVRNMDGRHVLIIGVNRQVPKKKILSALEKMSLELPFIVYPKGWLKDLGEGLSCGYILEDSEDVFRLRSDYVIRRFWTTQKIYEETFSKDNLYETEIVPEIKQVIKGCGEYVFQDQDFSIPPFRWDMWDSKSIPMIMEVELVYDEPWYSSFFAQEVDKEFVKMLQHYLGNDMWIPFDMKERRQKFPKAFEELQPYMGNNGAEDQDISAGKNSSTSVTKKHKGVLRRVWEAIINKE